MTLANFDAFVAALADPATSAQYIKHSGAFGGQPRAGFEIGASYWISDGTPVAATSPTTAEACNASTPGGLELSGRPSPMIVASAQRLRGINTEASQPRQYITILYDRLSHQGGLVANTNAVQSTNLPTAALTRYTDGVGVYAFIEVSLAWGGGASVLSVSYTNQAGTPGRTGQFVYSGIHGGGRRYVHAVGLQAGDTGVRSVESVQFSVSTGTAGGWGIVLAKPSAIVASEHRLARSTAIEIVGWNTPIHADACLWPVPWAPATGYTHGVEFGFAQG